MLQNTIPSFHFFLFSFILFYSNYKTFREREKKVVLSIIRGMLSTLDRVIERKHRHTYKIPIHMYHLPKPKIIINKIYNCILTN